MLLSESLFGNTFPPFEPGFSSWETHEPLFNFHPVPLQAQEPVSSNSGSDTPNPPPVTPKTNRKRSKCEGSGSDEPNRSDLKNLSSGSDDSSLFGCIIDERKRRRMMSNRESARRSRVRKQNHLENLRNQLNRLKIANRDLATRLRLVAHQNQLVHGENEYLRSESAMLRQRLWDIRQVLLVRQLQQHLNLSA
ncbi:hypothetical protein BUALT_Bualt04G0098100 [Buddleja alternifolia]|uniref:BZIP domain-containing protein n=1 Tax=Buddleja alternifolia TaxID=168488 RepID=A0AAV6XS26_9LAMI|nr:hypothetical protein BUALT_Bualt04G0098100 [Buddleja alternifolia]